MKRRSLIIAILGSFQFFIGLAYSTPKILQKLNMPGELAKEHAEHEDDCETCHLDWQGVKDERCLECHEEMKKIIAPGKGLHFTKFKKTCVSCHLDHKIHFDEAKFQHKEAGYELTGKHAQLKCNQCHTSEGKREIEPQPKIGRYIGLQTECVFCHQKDDDGEKGHRGQLGDRCDRCHLENGWKPSTYLHAEQQIERVEKSRWRQVLAWLLPERITPKDKIIVYKYDLKGKHANLKCEQCHKDKRYKATRADCISCHAKKDKHVKELGRDCERCHTPNGWDVISFDHRLAAFPLRGEHARLPCNSCHQSNQYKETSSRCQHCHAGSVSHANDINSDCEICHTSEFSWQVVTFNHNQSRFPLRQKHKSVRCWDCHREETFEGLSRECFTCHRDVHQDEFGSKCEVCHSEMAWAPANFNHSPTGFPLTGKHIAADCADCHPNGSYQNTPKDCYSCHRQNTPEAHYGIVCDNCHTTSSWKGAQFKHIEFLISGKHRKADCVDCHPIRDFYQEFTCIGGGCHPKDKMDKKHRNKRGYVYDSIACFRCHPTGKEEEHDDD